MNTTDNWFTVNESCKYVFCTFVWMHFCLRVHVHTYIKQRYTSHIRTCVTTLYSVGHKKLMAYSYNHHFNTSEMKLC